MKFCALFNDFLAHPAGLEAETHHFMTNRGAKSALANPNNQMKQ